MPNSPKSLPVLSGRLRNRRERIKENVVSYAIARIGDQTIVSVEDVSEVLSDEGFSLDESDIQKRLYSLVQEGDLEHISDNRFRMKSTEDFEDFDDKIDRLWEEFREELLEEYDDVDFVNLDEDMKEVFQLFFKELYTAVFDTTEELVESEVDPLTYVDSTEILDNLIDSHRIHKRNVYKEAILQYLENPSEILTEVTRILYTATINYHILKSGKDIDFNSIPAEGKVLFYDTNLLVSMLCKSKDLNPIVSAVTKRSDDLDFEQYYIPETAQELDELIRMSKREMDDIGTLPPNSEPVKNELLEEYYFGDEFGSLSEYHSYLSDWRTYVQVQFNLDEYDGDLQQDDAVFEWARETIREFDKASGDLDVSKKDSDNIQLDAKLLAVLATLRDEIDSDLDVGPNVISRDKDVLRTSNSGQPHFWDYNIAVHPRQWLNYLLAYTSVEFDEDDWDNIARGILDMSTSFDEEWTIEKYARVLSDKLDHGGNPETLEKFMIESPKSRDIKQGLREKDGNKAEKAIAETAGNEKFCQAFKNSLEADERVDQMLETINQQREKIDELESNQDESSTVVEVDASSETNVNQNVDATSQSGSEATSTAVSSAQSKQELVDNVNEFIEMLDMNLEGGIENSDVPSPPEDPSNLEKTKQWLNNFVDYVNTGSQVAQGAKLLAPTAKELIPAVAALL